MDCAVENEAVNFVDQLCEALVGDQPAHSSQYYIYQAQKSERDTVGDERSSCNQKQRRVVPRILKVQRYGYHLRRVNVVKNESVKVEHLDARSVREVRIEGVEIAWGFNVEQ